MALLVTFAKELTFVVSPNLMYPPLKSLPGQTGGVSSKLPKVAQH